MEGSDNFIDPENEVKKLQALVKKLEKQNELLRVKQKPSLDGTHPHEGIRPTGISSTHTASSNQAHPSSSALKNKVSEVGLEAVDVLDVDHLSLKDEEDSWLYSSPKALTPQQSNINLYEWVRQDFDHPSPELESARRSLLSKLDEVARMNRSSSTPALASTMPPAKGLSPLSRSTEDSRQYCSHYKEDSPKRSSIPHHRYSMLQPKGSHMENGTYTRRKKPEEQPRFVMGDKERSEEVPYHLRESTDVERLARQQEESLRQSMATYTSPKRVLQNKSMSFASDTDNSGSTLGSSRSSPVHYDYERHRNSLGSDCSTPPDSPSVIQQHSTPNLDQAFAGRNATVSRLQYPHSALHSSNSSLEHQPVGSTDELTHESRITSHLPSPGLRSASPAAGGLRTGLANNHGLLAQRSALPTPRRGIPRPSVPASARSSLPTTRRSGIPSQRPFSAQGRNESWRDGCF